MAPLLETWAKLYQGFRGSILPRFFRCSMYGVMARSGKSPFSEAMYCVTYTVLSLCCTCILDAHIYIYSSTVENILCLISVQSTVSKHSQSQNYCFNRNKYGLIERLYGLIVFGINLGIALTKLLENYYNDNIL